VVLEETRKLPGPQGRDRTKIAEREEQLALLREEEERLGAGGLGFPRSLVIFSGLSFVFHFSYISWRSASGRLHLDGSGATHP